MARITIGPQALGIGPNHGRGVEVMDWSDNSSLQNSAGTAELRTITDGPPGLGVTKCLRLTYNATPSFGQCDRSLNVGNLSPFFTNTGIGFWARNPSARTLQVEVRLFENGAARIIVYNFAIRPSGDKWEFYTAPVNNVTSNTITTGDVYRYVRITQGSSEWAWQSGDYCDFGPVYLNPRGRAKFMLITDDGFTANLVNGTGFPTSYPASGGNYLDIANAYGFKCSAAIITGLVGASGRMTWDQIRTLRDAGWSIVNHGTQDWTGTGNQGMTFMSAEQVRDDIRAAAAAMQAQGVGRDAMIFNLPQGAWTDTVMRGCINAGCELVAGVGNTTTATRGGLIAVGIPGGGGHTNGLSGGPAISAGFPDLPSRMQADGSPILSDFTTYIDDLVRYGAVGGTYSHSITATIATLFDGICAYLQRLSRQGLIDVITMRQFQDQRTGGRAPR